MANKKNDVEDPLFSLLGGDKMEVLSVVAEVLTPMRNLIVKRMNAAGQVVGTEETFEVSCSTEPTGLVVVKDNLGEPAVLVESYLAKKFLAGEEVPLNATTTAQLVDQAFVAEEPLMQKIREIAEAPISVKSLEGTVREAKKTLTEAVDRIVARCSKYSGYDLSWGIVDIEGVKCLRIDQLGAPNSVLIVSRLECGCLKEVYGRLSHWAVTVGEEEVLSNALAYL